MTILIIRHAEKPVGNIAGVDIQGTPDDESLTPQGWQRAGALAAVFGSREDLPLPDRIYASPAIKVKIAPQEKIGSNSKRPVETVTPLADKNKISPLQSFTKGQEAGLAEEIVTLSGVTLVCWQHEAIPAIAAGILGSAAGIPQIWPDTRFDVIWRFRQTGTETWVFDQLCQQLLDGDDNSIIV